MSNLRIDLVTGNSVIISEKRNLRPMEIQAKEIITHDENDLSKCPFCRGNEEKTPPNMLIEGDPWTIRVVENKYPAVTDEETTCNEDDIYCEKEITGKHYVIIDSYKHYNYMHNMSESEIISLLKVYSHVIKELYKEHGIKHVQIFKNYKKEGGASLVHTHSQVMALNFVPKNMEDTIKNSKKYFEDKSSCLFCDIIKKELKDKKRVIIENDAFVAFSPYASMFPYEISIFPKNHMSKFTDLVGEDFGNLSNLLKYIFTKLYKNLNDPAYNMYINSINEENESYHWSLRIVPRTNVQAGFEISTGVMINTISPESTKILLSL